MKKHSHLQTALSIAMCLFTIEAFCSTENSPNSSTESNNSQTNDASSTSNDQEGPSVAEVLINIANDPGAAAGGDR